MHELSKVEIVKRIKAEVRQRADNHLTAYPEICLDVARKVLAEMCEIGVFQLGYDFPLWFGMFAHSKYGKMFCSGEGLVNGGISGARLAQWVEEYYLGESKVLCPSEYPHPSSLLPYDEPSDKQFRNFGSNMAYLQWYLGKGFHEIMLWVPVQLALPVSEKAISAGDMSGELFIYEMEQKIESMKLHVDG